MKSRAKQQGLAVIVFLALLTTAAAGMAVKAIKNNGNNQIERDKITAAALAQAKEALIGYAVSQTPVTTAAYLPLPDLGTSRNNNIIPGEGTAAANFSGNHKNLTVIGRLPWRTLNLSPLRDGQGECLWYAVSGSFQNSRQADVLNWDSLGHLDTHTSNGTSAGTVSTTGANYTQRPVAIIFSASAILPGQNRQTSTTDTVSTCGGNYDVRNYLDAFNADSNINNIVNYFTGTTNNATGYAYNLNSASDGSQLSAADLLAPINDISGDIEVIIAGKPVKIVNDKILTITADEIFKSVIKRTDFRAQITALMNDTTFIPYLKTLSLTLPGTGAKGTGKINCDKTSTSSNKDFCNNWKEMLLLTQLPSPSPSCAPADTRVLIFGGWKTGVQVRLTATDKSNPDNYLEAPNRAAFFVPIAFSNSFGGATTFDSNSPYQDLLRCL